MSLTSSLLHCAANKRTDKETITKQQLQAMLKITVKFELIANSTAVLGDLEKWTDEISKSYADMPKGYSSYNMRKYVELGHQNEFGEFISLTDTKLTPA